MIACRVREQQKSRFGDRGGFFRLSSRPYYGDRTMRLLIALILPWLTFFTIGRPISGLICLILQVTLIGWLPATIWAVYALSQFKTDQKIEQAFGRRP
ncbi:Hypothetical protein GbCGDNIH2_1368 [Granulibacter bethesdensis]|uniref:Stress induced hydrophobic peptide n=2 Tax=Granulibacter bethesdensis TaxID=364410 RepID=Q0BSD6_GRABC|nr:Hypothetical protein GbCGDNIH1_1368 [Granulibacter bethesdensis CGDNIH1]AHJ68825.1 Hypothetical protein GbCGDNIH2_1368 [Granulibacter bethesdensis]APH52092.1 Hypothetical protein GbCGDNIH5_1368 [Granulibacter bethesdensis]APH64783.1 Hypothetical protein GbCGDNIH1I4_1368 [Granulibacter bethesdensis]